MPRRKCFISYHHADQGTVDAFVRTFDHRSDVLIARRLGEMPGDIIDSMDTDYVMRRIREDYIGDASVTIVMMGACTWARRYVDWEIQASLRYSQGTLPNGLLGIKLPAFSQFPQRFFDNLRRPTDADGFAGYIDYPQSLEALTSAIDWAFNRRDSHKQYIRNPRDRMANNRQCP